MDTKQEFKIYCSDITKSLDPNYNVKDKTQPLILEGVASTSDIDLEGDFITPQCIESFKSQATQCNIHNNHNVGLDDVIGTVLEVLDSDNKTLKIKFSILPLFRRHIEECIDNGVKLGLSIGGTILDFDNGDDGLKINNMMLHEISLTPLPANWNTMGTVTHSKKLDDGVIEAKCLNGMCKQFLNKISITDKVMETEKRYYTKDEEAQFMSEDRVVELINEALNNFASNGVTEERVGEIIDEKLKDFVEQAKALEKEEEEEKEKAKKKAKKTPKKTDEEELTTEQLVERLAELESQLKALTDKKEEEDEDEEEEKSKKKSKKSDKKEETDEELKQRIAELEAKLNKIEKADEEKEKEEDEEDEEEEKSKKKSLMGEMSASEFGEIIAQAVNKNQQSTESIEDMLSDLKSDLQAEISKAMDTTREDIEKSLFESFKKSAPSGKTDDAQLKKFLKTKAERESSSNGTLNVKEIAKTLARKQ